MIYDIVHDTSGFNALSDLGYDFDFQNNYTLFLCQISACYTTFRIGYLGLMDSLKLESIQNHVPFLTL